MLLDIPLMGELYSWFFAAAFLLVGHFIFGSRGLYSFMTAAVLLANIQVLKIIDIPLSSNPIAMGTAVMSLTFVVTDFLTEKLSLRAAKHAIMMGFSNYLLFSLLLWLSVATPLSVEATPFHQTQHVALKSLFITTPGIFLASLIAYVISQVLDIYAFSYLKKKWHNQQFGLRSFVSSSLAAFIDNFIFSLLAWIVFHPHPLPFEIVWSTFILSGFAMRLAFTFLNVPLILVLRLIHEHRRHD